MLSVIVCDYATWELNSWLHGVRNPFADGVIGALDFSRGRACPVPHEIKKGGSLAFSVSRDGSPQATGFVDVRDGSEEVSIEALRRVDHYFKLNYNEDHLRTRLPAGLFEKIHPTGLWLPIRLGSRISEVRRSIRMALRANGPAGAGSMYDAFQFNIGAARFPSLEDFTIVLAAERERDSDLFWKARAWNGDSDRGRVSAQRLAVMKVLDRVRDSRSYRLLYGFADSPIARERSPEHTVGGRRRGGHT